VVANWWRSHVIDFLCATTCHFFNLKLERHKEDAKIDQKCGFWNCTWKVSVPSFLCRLMALHENPQTLVFYLKGHQKTFSIGLFWSSCATCGNGICTNTTQLSCHVVYNVFMRRHSLTFIQQQPGSYVPKGYVLVTKSDNTIPLCYMLQQKNCPISTTRCLF
jgi:hypothetical protein